MQQGFVAQNWVRPIKAEDTLQQQPTIMPEQPTSIGADDNDGDQKNAVFLLNRKFPKVMPLIRFDKLQMPSKLTDNKPIFRCTAKVQEREISATGFSKKQAKTNLAAELLEYLDVTRPDVGLTFTSATASKPAAGGRKRSANGQAVGDGNQTPGGPRNDAKRRKLIEKLDGSNFVQVFQQMCTVMGDQYKPFKLDYVCCSPADAKSHETVYECHMAVGDKKFFTKGIGKRHLKEEAVKQAFKELFAIELDNEIKESRRNEILTFLASNGRKNLRQSLQMYAGRHSIPFKVECQETVTDNNPLAQAKSPAAAGFKIRKYVATCQFGEENFQFESPVSKKDCLDQLFINVLSAVFHVDLEAAGIEIDKCSSACSAPLAGVGPTSDKNPVSLLHELSLKNGLKVLFSDPTEAEISADLASKPSPPPAKDFASKLTVNDNTVIGYGKSKKTARQDAAVQMLKLAFCLDLTENSAFKLPSSDTTKDDRRRTADKQKFLAQASQGQPDRLHAAKVAYYAKMKYAEILKPFNVVPLTTFAAFLIRDADKSDDEFEVVSLASGSRTSQIWSAMPGINLRDCHGTVLARRGLLLYFYDQLAKLSGPEADKSIFEPVTDQKPNAPKDQQFYRLKSNYSVHLYDSRIPPGDASADQYDFNFRSCLRCYQKDGISTVPVTVVSRQMADTQTQFISMMANVGQDDDKSMSLSDKMLKWNVVGLQGALLSAFLEPIYLESLVIGQDFNKTAVRKSIFGRFDSTEWAQQANAPALLSDSSLAKYQPKCPIVYNLEFDPIKAQMMQQQQDQSKNKKRGDPKSSPLVSGDDDLKEPTDFGLTWQSCCPMVEFVFQDTGLDIQRKMSRLSKQNIFDRYSKLRQMLSLPRSQEFGFYVKAKQCSTAYSSAKMSFKNLLKAHNLGAWLEKSDVVDHFTLPWLSDSLTELIEDGLFAV